MNARQQSERLEELGAKIEAGTATKAERREYLLVKLLTAEITASKDMDSADADRQTSLIETQLGLAHELGLTAMEHEHQQAMADKNAAIASAQAFPVDAAQQPQETQ